MSFVFPAELLDQRADAIAQQLTDYLLDGETSRGVIGLEGIGNANAPDFVGLRFVQRAGTGVAGDETTYVTATVIFPDDAEPGIPRVKIVDVTFDGSPVVWGDGQSYVRGRVILDVWSSEFTGSVTSGIDPKGSESLLAGWVYEMLGDDEAMKLWGFHDTNIVPDAGDVSGVDFHIPMSLTFEAYFNNF